MSVMSISTVTCRSSSMRTLAVAGPPQVAADRRRHAEADQPLAVLQRARARAAGCSQPNCSAPSCRQATSARVEKGTCFSGILGRLVAQPQLDRIEVELVGQLVHRLLERELADRLARRAHRIGDRQVERHDAMAWSSRLGAA